MADAGLSKDRRYRGLASVGLQSSDWGRAAGGGECAVELDGGVGSIDGMRQDISRVDAAPRVESDTVSEQTACISAATFHSRIR